MDVKFQVRLSVVAAAVLSAVTVVDVAGGTAVPRQTAPPQPADVREGDEPVAPSAPKQEAPELASIRQWFGDLDDPDATVREQARVKLMGMQRRDLPAFQKLVQDSRPLMPAQAAVLRQLVMHVYLAGEPYDTTGTQGFLGVRMQDTAVRVPGGDGHDPSGANPPRTDTVSPAVGVVIVERMPGFVGSRMLLDGDVILGVNERQDVRMLGVFEFAAVVQSITPGTTVHFQILRQGQVIRVPVVLDPKPFEAEPFQLSELIFRRQRKAEDYWNRSFAGLVKESVG